MSTAPQATKAVSFRPATAQDMANIRALLEANKLPTADLADSRPEFVIAAADSLLIGVAGLQRFGNVALLRSLAVAERSRGSGTGGALVRELERLARVLGVHELVLLTETAERFFASRGYQRIERTGLPPSILETAEFRSLCPASAACMSKRLDATA
jgi:amino-acid N-acetyltransferase